MTFSGRTRLCIDVTGNGIEPRLGGIQDIEIDLDDTTFFGGTAGDVAVECQDNAGTLTDESGRVAAVALTANTLNLTFSPELPDESRCTVTLNCGASVCLQGLRGDTNRDGTTSTADASIIKPKFGGDPAIQGAQFDYNVDGTISTADFSQVKPLFGNSSPSCP